MLLPIHIAAGGLAIVLGAVALSAKKGGTIHRRSGLLFVYAMLVMGWSQVAETVPNTQLFRKAYASLHGGRSLQLARYVKSQQLYNTKLT